MFLLSTINAFGILWSAFLWGIAGVGVSLLVLFPIYFIFLSLTNDDSETQRYVMFVVSAIVLIAILSGGSLEYQRQERQRYQLNKSSLERPLALYESPLSTTENF